MLPNQNLENNKNGPFLICFPLPVSLPEESSLRFEREKTVVHSPTEKVTQGSPSRSKCLVFSLSERAAPE